MVKYNFSVVSSLFLFLSAAQSVVTAVSIQEGFNKKQSGVVVVPLEPYNDDSGGLIAKVIGVGTEPKVYRLSLDTSIKNIFLVGPDTSPAPDVKIYDPSQSTSANNTGEKFHSDSCYNNDYCSGDYYTDTMWFSGMAARNQTISVFTNVTRYFGFGNFDGVMGLGFVPRFDANKFHSLPIFTSLFEQGQIPSPVFSISPQTKELVLGGIPDGIDVEKLVYVNTTHHDAWAIAGKEIELVKDSIPNNNNNSTIFKLPEGSDFHLSSPIPTMSLPDNIVCRLVHGITGLPPVIDPAANYYKISCDYKKSHDIVKIYFTSPLDNETGRPTAFISVPVSRLVFYLFPSDRCIFHIKPILNAHFTLGSRELWKYVTVYDSSRVIPRVAFAPYVTKY